MKPLKRSFYERETSIVAQKLLGKYLVRKIGDTILVGKIIETEAYLPFDDPAAHSYKGKTKRTDVLFGAAGHAYVHSIHTHHCLDIVTETEDVPGSVLIRAIEPIEGIEMKTDGPGKLCKALVIDKSLYGIDMTDPASELYVTEGEKVEIEDIKKTPRIGITKATERILRFRV